MRDDDVLALCRDLAAHGVTFWLMGGWGVDALLGRQTRPHHDVDLLVEVASLDRLRARLEALGFAFAYLWDDECRWVREPGWDAAHPTAFVHRHADGREVDVHALRAPGDGTVDVLWNAPYDLTADGLLGEGAVAGERVPCLSADMQRAAHTGYDLPPHHAADLRLLAEARPGRAP